MSEKIPDDLYELLEKMNQSLKLLNANVSSLHDLVQCLVIYPNMNKIRSSADSNEIDK